MNRIFTDRTRFLDDEGRQRIFSGINLVFKGRKIDGGKGFDYIGPWVEEDFKHLHEWGFNIVRLGLIWDGVELEPGKYDEDYLDWIEKMLDYCEKYCIYAFLDMHQDLYSCLYADGAPEWATLSDGLPHTACELWSDSYIFSEAVKRSYDNFWANVPAGDGMGLQDHYAAMWEHIAKRFANHPALLGYDVLNEPYPGSSGALIFGTLIGAFTEISNNVTGDRNTMEEMMGVFTDRRRKYEALHLLENKELFEVMAGAAVPLVAAFDKGNLAAFYRKINSAIRRADKDGLIMIENSYFSNLGIECQSDAITRDDGTIEPRQAFSPHGYDLVVDTEDIVYASANRVDVIFDAHRRAEEHMGIPVIVGEWGAHGRYREGLSHIEHLIGIFEKYLWSNTYWCHYDNFEDAPVLKILKRPYPQAAAGKLLLYHYDQNTGIFKMEWDEEGEAKAPSIIYLPGGAYDIDCDGEYSIEKISDDSECIFLLVPPTGKGKRNLRLKIQG